MKATVLIKDGERWLEEVNPHQYNPYSTEWVNKEASLFSILTSDTSLQPGDIVSLEDFDIVWQYHNHLVDAWFNCKNEAEAKEWEAIDGKVRQIAHRKPAQHPVEGEQGKEIERLQEALDFNVAENMKLIKQIGMKAIHPVKVVCYCGSLRVALEAFKKAEYESIFKPEIALLPCCMFVDIQRVYGENSDYKVKADELHKRKIDLCDEVFVLNVGGYIGASTRSEIEYAESIGKPIKYLEV